MVIYGYIYGWLKVALQTCCRHLLPGGMFVLLQTKKKDVIKIITTLKYCLTHLAFSYSTHLTGAGNFGSVMRGIYSRNGQRIPVAIKTLKQDDVPNAEVGSSNLCKTTCPFSTSTAVKPPNQYTQNAENVKILYRYQKITGIFRVARAQGKQGIWLLTFPDRENTGNLVNLIFYTGDIVPTQEKF